LKPLELQRTDKSSAGFNQPKTLSGIETAAIQGFETFDRASTNPKPFQGLKHVLWHSQPEEKHGFNQPKTLSGIETRFLWIAIRSNLPQLQPTQNPFRD